jgi:thiamine pyrophosphate-dependent acetolactate synthase large subunit-like protein/nitrite reductase/ring-hydroxylating ferredoxin subunit
MRKRPTAPEPEAVTLVNYEPGHTTSPSEQPMTQTEHPLQWIPVATTSDLPDGRVTTVTAGTQTLALCHAQGQYAAMDNRCPHQGGPLGEGSIETGVDGKCWLRCPWHGWDFDPLTGKPPGGHEDSGQRMYPVKIEGEQILVGLPEEQAHIETVTDVMAQTMVNWGVTSVFGMVGHSNLGLADALRRQEISGNLQFYGIRHEGAAAFACSAYGKLTGEPAACLTIAGPGATNLMTGLWDARVDRAPLLALTGQVDVQVLGPGAFQEIDQTSAFAPVTAFSQTVLHTSRHAELMSLACKNAIVQRDVAHLIFPDDVQTLPAADNDTPGHPDGRLGNQHIAPAADSIDAATALLAQHKRPIIIVGYGARNSMDTITALADKLHAPILTTFKAKGQIADSHPLAAGVLGRSGTPIASWFMNECDLILAFGCSFSNHTGITPKRPVIQVDFDPMALGRFHPVQVPILGENAITAKTIAAGLGKIDTIDQRGEVAERWRIWRAEKQSRADDNRGRGINSASIFASLQQHIDSDAIIAVDVGNNTYSFGRYFEVNNQRVLMSGYLGSIGFAFSAAMGAWAATQDKPAFKGRQVVSISGDGGFGQYLAEFTTAVKYNMNITHILLNNSELGKISKEQRTGQWDVWQTSLHNPDFSKFATLCGGLGIRVTATDAIDSAIRQALDYDGPALVELITDADLV